MRTRQRLSLQALVLGVSLVLGVALVACGGGGAAKPPEKEKAPAAPSAPVSAPAPAPKPKKEEPVYGGVFRYAEQSDNRTSWDPHGTAGGQQVHQNGNSLWYNNLLSRAQGVDVPGTNLDSFPDLAERWEVSSDGLAWTFFLRKGVKFHNKPPVNGRELTAEDVKWSYERFLKGPDSNRFILEAIQSIEVVDNYTVRFRLKEQDAAFLRHMGEPLAYITPKEAATAPKTPGWKLPEEFVAPDGIIGTGPFMFQEHQVNQRLVAVRNPNYFQKGLPYLDRVEYLIIPDASARLAAMAAGEVDFIAPPAGSILTFMRANPQVSLSQEEPGDPPLMVMRTDKAPFNDVRVRRAIMMAIDQDAILKTKRGSVTSRIYGPIVFTMFPDEAATPEQIGENAKWWQHNPEASKRLLAEAGYPDGFAAIYQASSCCLPDYLPELIADMLSKVGIKITVKVVDHAVHLKTSNIGKYDDIAHSRLKAADVDDVFSALLPENPKNTSHVNDPVLTKMVLEQRQVLDPAKRRTAVLDLQRYLAGQVYYFPMPHRFSDNVWQPWVKGYREHAGNTRGRDLESAWIDPAVKANPPKGTVGLRYQPKGVLPYEERLAAER